MFRPCIDCETRIYNPPKMRRRLCRRCFLIRKKQFKKLEEYDKLSKKEKDNLNIHNIQVHCSVCERKIHFKLGRPKAYCSTSCYRIYKKIYNAGWHSGYRLAKKRNDL